MKTDSGIKIPLPGHVIMKNVIFCMNPIIYAPSLIVFFHVPEAITCPSATDCGQEQLLCFDTAPRLKKPPHVPGCVRGAG